MARWPTRAKPATPALGYAPPVPHQHPRSDIDCRNCGTSAPLDFCPACGQETALHPPTLGEFLHEFIGHYVALEGALWRTLGLLLFLPGRLTRQYLAGRRRRYVLPLRMYLTASFVFFLALKLLPSGLDTQGAMLDAAARPDATAADIQAAAASAASAAGGSARHTATFVLMGVECGGAGQPPCNRLERFINGVGERFRHDPRSFVEKVRSQLYGAAPYAIFLLLPVFSGVVMLAYRNRRMTYGEHVVFSLHLHAFWFIALLLMTLLPVALADVLLCLVPVYGVLAMRHVYGGRWFATVLRAAFVSVVYGIVLVLVSLGLMLAFVAKA